MHNFLRPASTSQPAATAVASSSTSQPAPTAVASATASVPHREQTDMSAFVGGKESLTAEVLWALKVVCAHYSCKSCENISALFMRMFPDSAIAQKFSCGERKCAYLACFGIAPFFQQQLVQYVKQLDGYVLMFDESANKTTQTKQMDIHLRFWQYDHVTSRYLSSTFLGHSSATDMLQKISTCLTDNSVSMSKVVPLSMDGPNVNLKLHALMDEELCSETEGAPALLSVGSCGTMPSRQVLRLLNGELRTSYRCSTGSSLIRQLEERISLK